MNITTYPLTWPDGWKRTKAGAQVRAKFHKMTTTYRDSFSQPGQREAVKRKGEVTIAEGTSRVIGALRAMGVQDFNTIISSNLQVRNDGLPRSGQKAPDDPGVAVYWKHKDRQQVMAIDQYDRVADNLAAVAATLEAMRAIQRHGGATILERAFTGFEALPAPGAHKGWRVVMGFLPDERVTLDVLADRFRHLTKTRHPDTSTGSHDAMTELNGAYAHAQRELSP
jgi:hypothetical protein